MTLEYLERLVYLVNDAINQVYNNVWVLIITYLFALYNRRERRRDTDQILEQSRRDTDRILERLPKASPVHVNSPVHRHVTDTATLATSESAGVVVTVPTRQIKSHGNSPNVRLVPKN